MGKHKGDIEIGWRASEEAIRVFGGCRAAGRALGCGHGIITEWANGRTPSGAILARMHHCGCDVMYVLTGKRHKS